VFDLSYHKCDAHEDHGYFTIKLGAKALENFVALVHYNNGEWEVIENAKVLADGETLEFKAKDFSPFAIVVDTSGGQTGDNGMVYVYAIIMAVSAVALAVIFVKTKKQKAVA
jgi:hypothetical protein